MQLFEEINYKKGIGNCYFNMGVVYINQSNYPKALDCFLKALKVFEETANKNGVGFCYNSIGNIYAGQTNFTKALDYYLKALKIRQEIDDKQGVGTCFMNIGIVYASQKNFPKSQDNFFKALKIAMEIGDKQSIGDCYNNIGNGYQFQSDHPNALKYQLKALQIREEIGDKKGVAACHNNMSVLYAHLSDYNLAIKYSDSALLMSKQIGDIDNMRLAYQNLAAVYSKTGKYKNAYENHVKFKQLTDSIFNSENSKQLGDLKTNFEVQKKELELEAKAKAQEAISTEQKKRQQYVIYSVIGLLTIVLIFAVFMFNRFKVTQKQKNIIEKQKYQVEEQKQLVEEKQREIVDSITYAKRLQQAILPSYEEINKHFPDSFILYKPKDIVAGDFYWMEYLSETIYIAAADSTGHGVPGAMVSVVCSNALNRAVKEFGLKETGKILDKTRELVLETFAKSGEEIKDGMDISLLAINKRKKQIEWSGANNQLWYSSNKQLLEVKPDKQAIGKTDNPSQFTTHSIEFCKSDVFYLMTDGYPDQFGGPNGKKFKYKQLEKLLEVNSDRDMSMQKEILEKSFLDWKGNLEQVDDVCIIGIRL